MGWMLLLTVGLLAGVFWAGYALGRDVERRRWEESAGGF